MRTNILFVLSVMCLFSGSVFAIGGDMGGATQDGSADFPYLIEDFNDFQAFCADPNYWDDCVRLDCDLDLDPNLQSRVVYSESPIANGPYFSGSFDGNDHTISNLTVDGVNYCGLFGKTEPGSSITDLGIENASVTGSGDYVAALVGYNGGKDGGSSITSCYSTGEINGDRHIGGLVGYNYGIITSSYSTGEVTGNSNVGGLVGMNYGSNFGIITSCYSTGEVNGDNGVGGLVGMNLGSNFGSIINSYSTGKINGDSGVGGLVGINVDSITSCYSTGEVNGNYDAGGLVGRNDGSITSSFWDTQTSAMTIGVGYGTTTGTTGKTTLEMQTENTFTDAGWDFLGEIANGTSQTWQMPVGGGYPVQSVFTGYVPVVLCGSGSKENPYLIGDANDLGVVIYYDNSACYKLIADINLAGIQWPTAIIPRFAGHFDGDGYIISNLTVDGVNYCGLFGKTEPGSSITDLSLENASVTGSDDYVAALVGYNDGSSIASCYSTGEVNGYNGVGGLVGINYGSITSSYSTGEVNGNGSVGGLAGINDGSITSCYSTGEVIGNSNVGGLVGINYSSITSSFWDTQTSAMTIGVGYGTTTGTTGKTTLEMQTENTFTDAGWDFLGEIANGTSQTWQMPVGGGYPVQSVFTGYVPVVLCGSGSKENPYLIGDANDLGVVIYYDNSACYKLIADINLAGIQWPTAIIPRFAGHFDGDGYIISNMNIDGCGYLGLFGRLYKEAVVANIGLESVMVTGTGNCVAALVGENYSGNITSSYSTGEVNGNSYVGSLVGYNNDFGSITSSYSTGTVNGNSEVGGLVGINYGNISSSYSTGAVNGNNYYVGGLVGYNYGSINSCYSTGEITGNYHRVGGLVGGNDGIITSSYYSTGAVNGNGGVGGLAGTTGGSSIITSSYSTGEVNGSRDAVGGLVGYNNNNSIIGSSYSTGKVTGDESVGGLVGKNYGSITSSYSTGAVNGNYDVGGLVGKNSRSITSSFWDTQTSAMTIGVGYGTTTGAIGKTTLEMQTENTFTDAGWDFVGEDIWDICDGMNYPKLSWQIPVVGDFVCGDGVDIVDFAVLAETWNLSLGQTGYNYKCDLSGNETIDFADLAIFCDNWLGGI